MSAARPATVRTQASPARPATVPAQRVTYLPVWLRQITQSPLWYLRHLSHFLLSSPQTSQMSLNCFTLNNSSTSPLPRTRCPETRCICPLWPWVPWSETAMSPVTSMLTGYIFFRLISSPKQQPSFSYLENQQNQAFSRHSPRLRSVLWLVPWLQSRATSTL